MSCSIEILEWDSNFFNIKVGRVTSPILDNNELSAVLKELKKMKIDLGYYSSPLPLTLFPGIPYLYDINLVDKKITYLKNINENIIFSNSVKEYKAQYPDKKLLQLAVESGIYSRFNVDAKIGRSKYEELYKKWIINSVNKKIANKVLVYLDKNIVAGFVTLGEKNSRADIGIIAVDAEYRGKGIGKNLMSSAENWFANKNYNEMQVITQKDNLPACRLYESCGYKIDKMEYFYHLWKKD